MQSIPPGFGVPRWPHEMNGRDRRKPENRLKAPPNGVERRKGDRRR
jgi:hypothetical protein